MLRGALIAVVVLATTGLLVYVGLALYSRKAPAGLGLVEGQLRGCPDRPNCVCSEHPGVVAWVEPLTVPDRDAERGWQALAATVTGAGGTVHEQRADYLHATFSSPLFGFVDDFEARLTTDGREIHIRSAARAGYSDRGVNRGRVEALRAAFMDLLENG